MKRKILPAVVVLLVLCISLFAITACDSDGAVQDDQTKTEEENQAETEDENQEPSDEFQTVKLTERNFSEYFSFGYSTISTNQTVVDSRYHARVGEQIYTVTYDWIQDNKHQISSYYKVYDIYNFSKSIEIKVTKRSNVVSFKDVKIVFNGHRQEAWKGRKWTVSSGTLYLPQEGNGSVIVSATSIDQRSDPMFTWTSDGLSLTVTGSVVIKTEKAA